MFSCIVNNSYGTGFGPFRGYARNGAEPLVRALGVGYSLPKSSEPSSLRNHDAPHLIQMVAARLSRESQVNHIPRHAVRCWRKQNHWLTLAGQKLTWDMSRVLQHGTARQEHRQ